MNKLDYFRFFLYGFPVTISVIALFYYFPQQMHEFIALVLSVILLLVQFIVVLIISITIGIIISERKK